jgi:sugar lactone lactonase YvrE
MSIASYLFTALAMAVLYSSARGDTTATSVLGQGGSFTSNTANNGGISASSLSSPTSIAFDSGSNMYVCDASNNRVLYFPKGASTATRVYGQGGSFTSNAANNGGISATSLSNPSDICVDANDNLYIADASNNRVLYYSSGSTTASRVYGQAGSFTTGTARNGGITADSLSNPTGVAISSVGTLYVSDSGNNRVLVYPSGSTTATKVYGQGGLFNTWNFAPVTADSLYIPMGLKVDNLGNLYIVDGGNHRVLYYTGTNTTAARVYGQAGSFTSNTQNNGGVSASSLSLPRGVTADASGNVYIADGGNNRVLYYATGLTTATRVYGQSNSFTSNAMVNPPTANSLTLPSRVWADTSANVFVADLANNRVIYYPPFSTNPTTSPSNPNSTSTTCFHYHTLINYNGKTYSYQDLARGDEPECVVPHVVETRGVHVEIDCGGAYLKWHLYITGDHLIVTDKGYVKASDLTRDNTVSVRNVEVVCHPSKVEPFVTPINKYFGLNCLRSEVYADEVKVSTFGNYHYVPATWMHFAGRLFGIERASRWGDSIATTLKSYNLL